MADPVPQYYLTSRRLFPTPPSSPERIAPTTSSTSHPTPTTELPFPPPLETETSDMLSRTTMQITSSSSLPASLPLSSPTIEYDTSNPENRFKSYEGDVTQLSSGEIVPHGIGTMTYRDGSTYIGQWKMGRRHGKGTMNYKTPSLCEAHKLARDKRWAGEMSGYYNLEAGLEAAKALPPAFAAPESEPPLPLISNKANRERLFFEQPICYEGQWNQDTYWGEGKAHYPGGITFEGQFRYFWRDGEGTLNLLHKPPITGIFKLGQPLPSGQPTPSSSSISE